MKRNMAVMLLATVSAWAAPKQEGYRFDGTTGFKAGELQSQIKAESFSVAAWVRLENSKRPQMFLTMGSPSQDFSFYLYNNAVRMLVEGEPGSYGFATAKPPPPGVWVHYLGTYDGKTARIYRNGALEGETSIPLKRATFSNPLIVGALDGMDERAFKGAMTDIRIWNRALDAPEARHLAAEEAWQDQSRALVAHWLTQPNAMKIANQLKGGASLVSFQPALVVLRNTKAEGFQGIWYYNQPSGDEYVYKYSGGLGTYCAKHIPFAWYAPAVDKTFFCYGGTDADNKTLLHMVSYFDHKTGQVARPTLLLDKRTNDAHDNPVINLDDKGYIWIFSSSHGRGRPSYISRSVKPYDIESFQLMWTGNYSYPQPMYYPGKGFLFLHTWYVKGRGNYLMTSNPEGTEWSERRQLSYFEDGHYQLSWSWRNQKTGVAFNQHPRGKDLNYRTNIYYMESDDFGATWRTASGRKLDLPLAAKENPALALEYESKQRNCYIKEVQFDSQGRPIILFILSKGYQSGPANGPREWRTLRWTGVDWEERDTGIISGNNYDTGPLYIESDTTWRIIGPTELGPQPYNPGGEIAMWLTEDAGATWRKARQMTAGSEMNHTYVRQPVNAHPDFYGFWADGHGRKPSPSRLYFCNRAGDVFLLPRKMEGAFAPPERVIIQPPAK